jgi:hypothetical protein
MRSPFTSPVVHLLVETVDDSGSSRLNDDTDVITSMHAGVEQAQRVFDG